MTTNKLMISGYKFIKLDNVQERRDYLLRECVKLDIKGTILIATEGINVALGGPVDAIEQFEVMLKQDPAFSDMVFKYSHSKNYNFHRMRVRLKKEIVKFNMPDFDPAEKTGKYLSPAEFKAWMDEGKDITILDTRNDYEFEVGAFENALDPDIENFTELPDAVKEMNIDKKKPVVMYCTGGIRCEKASAWMMDQGYEDVYQLDGGIIKYLEEFGGEHYRGDCFVFDYREVVDADLKEKF